MAIHPFSHAPTGALVFGPGSARKVGTSGPLKKAQKVLVLSDQGVQRAGVLATVLESFGDRIARVETGVVADGDVAFTQAVAVAARELGVDAILAVGGGSVIDTAKGVGAVLATGKTLVELEGIATIRTRLPPFVAVPTTSGTGSEATQFAVIKDKEQGRKRIFMDVSLQPAGAVLDPELLLGLPRAVTAATGVDALTHAIEAMASKMRNPVATALACEAIRLLMVERALERALEKPEDVDARGACLVAANLAGQAVSSAMLGAVHAFAHALGALKGVPHGVANGVFLVPVMQHNRERARDAYALLARVLGVASADEAIAAVGRLVHDVAGVPQRLAALDIGAADLEAVAEQALADPDLPTNPASFDDAQVLALLQARL